MSADVERLRELAEAATRGPWHAFFGLHGDPFVVTDPQRPYFTTVATPSRAPDDYGWANTQFIAAANPATVLALLAELAAARSDNEGLRAEVESLRIDCGSLDRESRANLARWQSALDELAEVRAERDRLELASRPARSLRFPPGCF